MPTSSLTICRRINDYDDLTRSDFFARMAENQADRSSLARAQAHAPHIIYHSREQVDEAILNELLMNSSL